MKKSLYLLLILNLILINCQSQEVSDLKFIKNEAAKYLNDQGEISDKEYELFKENGKGFAITGLYNEIDLVNPKEGIYSIYRSSHHKIHFLLFQNKNVDILGLSDKEELYRSIKRVIEYSEEVDLCSEITRDYISRLITVFFKINRNPRIRYDSNCEYQKRFKSGSFSFNDLHLKLAEHLVDLKQLKSVDYYLDNPDFLILKELGYYYGLPEKNEKLNIGVYNFANYENQQPVKSFLLLDEGSYEIISINNRSQLLSSINRLISFAEENNYCYARTNDYVNILIKEYGYKRCLTQLTKELP